jgi:SAM-dependent methyltransferase
VAHLLEGIKELYTARREGLPSKEWTREEVSAYASFYLPTNIQKFSFVMNQVSKEIREEISQCQVIDFGTGPGTYLAAFLDTFGGSECGHLYGIDISDTMLEQAEKLVGGLFPDLKTKMHFEAEVRNYSEARGRFLIFGNSLNEMAARDVIEVIDKVNPTHLLFLEPGVPTVFDELMAVRDKLKEHGYLCHYPCPTMETCPIVKNSDELGEDDWCHQVWRGTHEPEVEHLGQLAKIDRKAMAFIGHLYVKDSAVLPKNSARFIRFLKETKHSFDWEICRSSENSEEGLEKARIEIPKKILSKKEAKEMKKISVGINFDYEIDKVLGNGKVRVKTLSFPSSL